MTRTPRSDLHTPGPWKLEERSIYALQHAGWRKGEEQFENRFYASVQAGRGTPTEELEANARLIAAAPELLHELEHLVRLMEPYEDRLPFPGLATLNGARAAIKKARGE